MRSGTLIRLLFMIALIAFTGVARSQDFRVGLAQVEIKPPVGFAMWGYLPTRPAIGTGDPLMARVIYFAARDSNAALVTLDLGRSFSPAHIGEVKKDVAERAGVQTVIMTASHTHSGPYIYDEYPPGETPEWLTRALHDIADGIVEAAKSAFPARLAVGFGHCSIGHNRRYVTNDGSVRMLWENPTKVSTYPVDPEVTVLRIDDDRGVARAVLVGYACHPVVFGPDNQMYSADFPGAMSRYVSREMPGEPLVAYIQGGCGDINPYMDKRLLVEDAVKLKDQTGEELGREVARVARALSPVAPDRPSVKHVAETFSFGGRLSPDAKLNAELNILVLNDRYCFVGLPGEPFVEFQMDLKRRAGLDAAFLMGYCNGYVRYLPTIRAASEGGYGAAGTVAAIEVGAPERMMNRAYNRLYSLTGRLSDKPEQ